ncbi:hypothetical protein [Ectothiorhodospira sp. BSL-9]|uniref:hypothetical protein n=1 Tax=Ectothiorhodospira sp. BSL-9 TaxID=1442136 RepID=UPI0007B4391E|nr:hypothetical protein [Ectothiorhodospira sp. BSL-9]ANB01376.1 hypothetical protein ECTOBSL9_0474 [Ectothiorhodospira sp. BSL-9]
MLRERLALWWRPFAPGVLDTIERDCVKALRDLDPAWANPKHPWLLMLMGNGRGWPLSQVLLRPALWIRLLGSLRKGAPTLVRLPVCATRLCVGARLRGRGQLRYHRKENALLVFEHDGMKVMKIAVCRATLNRDIRMHRRFGRQPGLTPRLLASDPSLKWMVCEYHPHGEPLSRGDALSRFMAEVAPAYYEVWKPRSRRVGDWLARVRLTPGEVSRYLHERQLSLPDEYLSMYAPVSLPYRGNVSKEIFTGRDGRLMVVDWEGVKLGLLAEGFLHVLPECEAQALQMLGRHSTERDLRPVDQLVLAAAISELKKAPGYKRLGITCHHLQQLQRRCATRQKVIES